MKERAALRRQRPDSAPRVTVPLMPTPTHTADDLKIGAAANAAAAAGLLAPEEVRRHAGIMAAAAGRSPELDRQILEWKKRRNG